MKSFSQRILKLGINPCVNVPQRVLEGLFKQAGANSGPIPVRGKLNGKRFTQTVVKYQGAWRLYLNTKMRVAADVDEGDKAKVEIAFDPTPRVVPMHPLLRRTLSKNKNARNAFEKLSPSRQKEILRYLHSLKTHESVIRNVQNIIVLLMGRESRKD